MNNILINKNVIDALKEIPDESVDCIVTSCPYYGLRSYKGADTIWGGDPECEHEWVSQYDNKDNLRFRDPNHVATVGNNKNSEIYSNPNVISNICSKCGAWKGQLGLEPTYQMYIEHLMLVTKELKRVLKKTGTLFWNMGDSYAGGHLGGSIYNKEWNISKADVIPQINKGRPQEHVNGISEKSLMMIPERFAMAMIDDGWILRNKIVWYKRDGLPSSVKDRFSNKWEYVFFFTKSKRYYFDLDSVRKPLAESSIKKTSRKKIKNTHQKYKGVYSNLTSEESEMYGSPRARNIRKKSSEKQDNPNGANPGDVNFDSVVYDPFDDPNIQSAFIEFLEKERPELLMPMVLDIPTRPHKFSHFAVFPETLVEPLIKAGCPRDGIVLDPFAGSGTTGVVAKELGRSSILIEISKEYCDIIKYRMNWGVGLDVEYEVIK